MTCKFRSSAIHSDTINFNQVVKVRSVPGTLTLLSYMHPCLHRLILVVAYLFGDERKTFYLEENFYHLIEIDCKKFCALATIGKIQP
jgi:hypothetical protein